MEMTNPAEAGEQVVVLGSPQPVLYHKVSAAWNGFLLYIPAMTDVSAITRPLLLYFHCTGHLIAHPPSSNLQHAAAEISLS